jgi:hypothetical protein
MRLSVVNRQHKPVVEVVQSVQAAVLALEMVSLKDFHGLLAPNPWSRPKQELFNSLEGHGSSFRGLREKPSDRLGS